MSIRGLVLVAAWLLVALALFGCATPCHLEDPPCEVPARVFD